MTYPINLPEILRIIRSNPYLKDLPDGAFRIPHPASENYTEQNIYIENVQRVLACIKFHFRTNSFSIYQYIGAYCDKESLPISLLSETISETIKLREDFFLAEITNWKIPPKLKKESKNTIIKYLGLTELFNDIPNSAISFYSYEGNSNFEHTYILQANPYSNALIEQLFSILLLKPLNKKPKLFFFCKDSKKSVQIKTKKDLKEILSAHLVSMKQWKHNWVYKVAKQELMDLLPISKSILRKIPISDFHFEKNTNEQGITTDSLCLGYKIPVFKLQRTTYKDNSVKLFSIYYKPNMPSGIHYKESIISTNINIFKEKLHLLFLNKNLSEVLPGIKSFLPAVVSNKEALLNSVLDLDSGDSLFSGMPLESFTVVTILHGHKIYLSSSGSRICILIKYTKKGVERCIYTSNGLRICRITNNLEQFKENIKALFDLDKEIFINWIRFWSMNNLYQDRYFH